MNAVIPRYPNCYIEPLQAVYCTKAAARAAQEALTEGMTNMQAMVERLRRVRYVSTLVIQQIDPQLQTFFNVNTQGDLKKAEAMLQSMARRKRL
jgi:molybdopterin-guanine dinucleotide biosynthesis protein A